MVVLRLLLLLLLFGGGFLFAVYQHWIPVPDRWNPWAPLDLRDKPTFVTGWKLRRLEDRPEACLAALDTGALDFSPVPDSEPQPGCPLRNVVRVEGSDVRFSESFLATCPLAAAWSLFERHGLQPAAQTHLGSRVEAVEHLGSYACRPISGGSRMSQHASANALDVAAFRLEDGQRVVLRNDWPDEGQKGEFLRAVRDAACDYFRATLGPAYNDAHADHFHFDMGSYFSRICR